MLRSMLKEARIRARMMVSFPVKPRLQTVRLHRCAGACGAKGPTGSSMPVRTLIPYVQYVCPVVNGFPF